MKNYMKNNVNNFISVRSIQTVSYFKLDGTKKHSKDIHDFPEIFYVDKGKHEVYVDDLLYSIGEGQVLIYAPNAEHYSVTPQRTNIAIISFDVDSEAISSLYNKVITLNSSQKELLSRVITSGLELFTPLPLNDSYVGMVTKKDTKEFELQILKNTLELLLLELYTSENNQAAIPGATNRENYKDSLTDAVVEYMRDNLTSSISLAKISTEFRVSISTVKSLFKARYNCGPMTYFINLKIDEAKRMIRETALTFTEISEHLDFSSVHYFSKLFKEKTGLTPSEYAKSVYK